MLLLCLAMPQKYTLLAVAEPQALADIAQALGEQWEATLVSCEADASAQLEEHAFDVLLADFNLGSGDGSDLLNHALEKRPKMVRALLAYEADLALVAAKVTDPYLILPKPIEPVSLKSRLEDALVPQDSSADQTASSPASAAGPAPFVPPVYAEVLKALEMPDVTKELIAQVIATDAALTSELMALSHSAYLGSKRSPTDPLAAVTSLGLDTVKGLVMALQFLAEHSNLRPGYLDLNQIWRHSTRVALLARDLVLFETRDRTLAAAALTAGLLHDLGKVVLVMNFDDMYGRVHSLGRKQPVPLWDIEKEIFGANHGEIGGCLVGMWNMPLPIVDAVALHHEPPLGEQTQLTPLAAVHVANVFAHELWPTADGFVAPKIHNAFLNEIGLLKRLPVWRAAIVNWILAAPRLKAGALGSDQGIAPPVPTLAPPPQSANYLPGPVAETQTTTTGQSSQTAEPAAPVSHAQSRRWVYAGVAAAVLALLVLWIETPALTNPDTIAARTPVAGQPPLADASSTTPPKTAAPAPSATPALAVVEPTPPPHASPAIIAQQIPEAHASSATVPQAAPSLPEPAPSSIQPAPTPTVAPQVPAANLSHPAKAPEHNPQPEFRLNGVFYDSARASAIINGQTVSLGERVNGAQVVAISRTSVTLQINGVRKTYSLR